MRGKTSHARPGWEEDYSRGRGQDGLVVRRTYGTCLGWGKVCRRRKLLLHRSTHGGRLRLSGGHGDVLGGRRFFLSSSSPLSHTVPYLTRVRRWGMREKWRGALSLSLFRLHPCDRECPPTSRQSDFSVALLYLFSRRRRESYSSSVPRRKLFFVCLSLLSTHATPFSPPTVLPRKGLGLLFLLRGMTNGTSLPLLP